MEYVALKLKFYSPIPLLYRIIMNRFIDLFFIHCIPVENIPPAYLYLLIEISIFIYIHNRKKYRLL